MRNWQIVISDSDNTASVKITNRTTVEAVEIYRELKQIYKANITLKGYGEDIKLSSKGRN